MIGAIGNIQFSFLQRFTFILNSTHVCTTKCGTFGGQECQMLCTNSEHSEPLIQLSSPTPNFLCVKCHKKTFHKTNAPSQ